MAKMIRNKANAEIIKKIIGKKTNYSSLSVDDRKNILIELLKTTNQFCPFTGLIFPEYMDFTIEHFYYQQARFPKKQLDWNNWIPCARNANKPPITKKDFIEEFDYPNVYSPEKVDYIDVLEYNPLNDEIRPKKSSNISIAMNTIKRFGLNDYNKKVAREHYFKRRKNGEINTSKYCFCEYIEKYFHSS